MYVPLATTPTLLMPADIFVSYSHKDREFVQQLVRWLEREWVVWWDEDLTFGDRFEPRIIDKIAAIPVVLIVISADSNESEWVRKETAIALRTAHPIPILKQNVPLPEELCSRHYCDLVGWDGELETTALKQLHRDIRLVLATKVPASPDEALSSILSTKDKSKNETARRVWKFLQYSLFLLPLIGAFLGWASRHNSHETPNVPTSIATLSADDPSSGNRFTVSYLFSEIDESRSLNPEAIRLIKEARFVEARALIETQIKTQTKVQRDRSRTDDLLLARMYDQGIGGSREPEKAVELFKSVIRARGTSADKLAAKFDLGLATIFGRGKPSDVPGGLEMIENAISGGFRLEKAAAAFHRGCCYEDIGTFAEIHKSIGKEASKGNMPAKALMAILNVHGLSTTPCVGCLPTAKEMAGELRQKGEAKWADLVDRVIEHERARTQAKALSDPEFQPKAPPTIEPKRASPPPRVRAR